MERWAEVTQVAPEVPNALCEAVMHADAVMCLGGNRACSAGRAEQTEAVKEGLDKGVRKISSFVPHLLLLQCLTN